MINLAASYFGQNSKVKEDKTFMAIPLRYKISRQITLLIIFISLVLTGCQTISETTSSQKISAADKRDSEFSRYYLWLKSLDDAELEQEIALQQQNIQAGNVKPIVHLIILYSLPNSPVHNPYTAKAQLNNLQLALQDDSIFIASDLAFFVMLKDQLNQQLLLLEKIKNYKGAYHQAKKMITAKQLQINHLKQQFIQLQKIEKNINERGQ